jgi:hypothetical protein
MCDEQELITQNYLRAMPLSNEYKQEKSLTFVKGFFDQTRWLIECFCIMPWKKEVGLFLNNR